MKKLPETIYLIKYQMNDEWFFAIRKNLYNFPILWENIHYKEIKTDEISEKITDKGFMK